MTDVYLVSIPIEPVTRATVENSRSHGLTNGLQLANILRVRLEETITKEGDTGTYGAATYLDIEVSDDNRNAAILQAYSIARRFVQLAALVYQAEFEISLVGVQAKNLSPGNRLEPSTHFGYQRDIASFEALIPIWKRIALIQEQDSQLWRVLELALEWLHFGAVVSDPRSIFLAYWIALELLIDSIENNERSTTVFKKHLDDKKRDLLRTALRGVLALYIGNKDDVERVTSYIEGTKVESDTKRWSRILNNAGVSVTPKELDDLNKARSSIVHDGIMNEKMSNSRMYEIVSAYINSLIKSN